MLKRAHSASQAPSSDDTDPQASPGEDAEYAALEATLRNSELGRRFLADYARQHPTPEVKLLLDAVERLEAASPQRDQKAEAHGLVSELVSMSETISQMRREIGSLNLLNDPGHDAIAAPCAFEQIVEASAQATSDVLVALEQIQDVAVSLREKGVASEDCDRLDESATDIYTACARREIAGQQTANALALLRDMERRIDLLIEDWSNQETQNLLDAAKALDVSAAFQQTTPRAKAGPSETSKASSSSEDRAAALEGHSRRTNRLVPQEEASAQVPKPLNADPHPAELPSMVDSILNGPHPFEGPTPLTFETLDARQRSALFG